MAESAHDDWERLGELLDEDPILSDDVRVAAADPAEYFRRHEERLVDRGIESPAEVEPWLALIDALDEIGALAYLDWRDTGAELAQALAGVPRVVRCGVDLDPLEDVEGGVEPAIVRADELLEPCGLRIVHLVEDSDAYPLVVVPTAHVEEIVSLATKVGHAARAFG